MRSERPETWVTFLPDTSVTLFAFCKREVWMPWKASSVMEQDLRSQGARAGGIERSLKATGALRQSATGSDRERDCAAQFASFMH